VLSSAEMKKKIIQLVAIRIMYDKILG
jgi:hypothetical protein